MVYLHSICKGEAGSKGQGGGGRGTYFYFENIEDPNFSIYDRKYKCIYSCLRSLLTDRQLFIRKIDFF